MTDGHSTWAPGTRGLVAFPDGRVVRGTGIRRSRAGVEPPELALALLGRRPAHPPWEQRWVSWPDFRLPRDTDDALAALRVAHERAALERVEIACGSGVGRTGTALAVLAVLSGIAPEAAIAWVRERYHRRAVETRAQKAWVLRAAERLAR